jgi:hypothetical protein
MMSFKQEILAALNGGKDHLALLEIIRRHQVSGQTAEESYDLLQQIWLEFGFHQSEDDSPFRNDLEYVMERVWYQGSFVED